MDERDIMRRIILAAILSGSLTGCGMPGDEQVDPTEQQTGEITGGQLVPANVGPPDTSVIAYWSDTFGFCSGTKIGPRRFLTAGHCIGNNWSVGQTMWITNQNNGGNPITVTVSRVRNHPTAQNLYDGNTTGPGYDASIIDVNENTPTIPSYNVFRVARVAAGTNGSLTAYGCDEVNDGNSWQRQYAFMPTAVEVDPLLDTYSLYTPGSPQLRTCGGDSGGPYFVKRNGIWEIAGIVSWGNTNDTWWVRSGNINAWIADPRSTQPAHLTRGFVINQLSNLCANASAQQSYCDGRDHLSGIDAQYWQLVANTTGTFRFKNTSSGRCLRVQTVFGNPTGVIDTATCGQAGVDDVQTWRFAEPLGGTFGQLRNPLTNRCLSINTSNQLRAVTCEPAKVNQRWLFTR
jgi:V8-like Glu-specific endopeptidase